MTSRLTFTIFGPQGMPSAPGASPWHHGTTAAPLRPGLSDDLHGADQTVQARLVEDQLAAQRADLAAPRAARGGARGAVELISLGIFDEDLSEDWLIIPYYSH